MRTSIFAAVLLMLSMRASALEPGTPATLTWPAGLPVYDHVVIVVEENKDFGQVIGKTATAPYINKVLRAEGATFTQMFGEEHNSQGNYFWLFSGSDQGVGFDDVIPTSQNNPNYPFQASNLGAQLIRKGLTFKGYAESLPAIGSTVDSAGTDTACSTPSHQAALYARKHVPWISFANVPNGTTVETSSDLRFEDFPSDFSKLPTVAFVIPNLHDDMHNCNPPGSVSTGDKWLRNHLDSYYQWAKKNNSLLILTFDENDDKVGYMGLTNPSFAPTKPDKCSRDVQNRTLTLFAGAHIKHGDYPEEKGIDHVTILRTLEAMFGLPKSGAQQPNAAGAAGITDDAIVTDVFMPVSK